jgi:hypothetical protein
MPILTRLLLAEIGKIIAKKLFGATVVSGIKKFIVDRIVSIIFKKILQPAFNLVEDFFKAIVDKKEIEKAVKNLEKAETKDEVKEAFHNLP